MLKRKKKHFLLKLYLLIDNTWSDIIWSEHQTAKHKLQNHAVNVIVVNLILTWLTKHFLFQMNIFITLSTCYVV